MHAVRRELLVRQAEAVNLPLFTLPLPWPCTNETYEALNAKFLFDIRHTEQITHVAFGDLFLQDVRNYREKQMTDAELVPVFPIWGLPTHDLSRQMVDEGLKARLTCVDPRRLPSTFAGREYDSSLLDELPAGVDPCGEAGEFHTFAYDGPMFNQSLEIVGGPIVERDGFYFADILPATDSA
jgi:diphthamide synthase (EF-2-diphthine--ammonia ligase)